MAIYTVESETEPGTFELAVPPGEEAQVEEAATTDPELQDLLKAKFTDKTSADRSATRANALVEYVFAG